MSQADAQLRCDNTDIQKERQVTIQTYRKKDK